MRYVRHGLIGVVAALAVGAGAHAQDAPSAALTARLRAALPAAVAQQVLSTAAQASSEHLPATAIVNRSLKFAARGVAPADIARAADDQLTRMRAARSTLQSAVRRPISSDEIEAGAEALREGVNGATVATLARSAPAGRSLAVPLYVLGNLVSSGVASERALQNVQRALAAHASDDDLQRQSASPEGPPASPPAAANPASTDDNKAAEASAAVPHGNADGNGHEKPKESPHVEHGSPAAPPGEEPHGTPHAGPPAGVPGNAGAKGRPGGPPGQVKKGGPPGKGHP